MANFVKFWDSLSVKPLEVPQAVKDYYANPPATNVKPLRVRIAATHAGKITRNNGFYLPHKMQAGAATFTAQFPKPVQVHHDAERDPVGRVIAARYVDLSGQVKDSWKAKKLTDSVFDSKLFDSFIAGTLPYKELLDVANKYFIQDAKLDDPDYEGLGYIEIIADITDPDAIQKVVDGRYMTGSTGAATNQAVCSVCKQDWAADGKCEHRPGQLYDGVKCVLIAGDLFYDEYSFVNKPADRHSRVIEVNINGVQDFVTLDPETVITDNEVIMMVDATSQSEEEQKMADENKEEPKVETTPLRDLFGEAYDEVIGTEPEGQVYGEMFLAWLESVSEAEKEEVRKQIVDATLTAAARKKLPKSVFCKPPDGYPVHDCAHAKAAMAYAKKYNEASSVVACIRRKASRLGCPFKEGDSVKTEDMFGQFIVDYFDTYNDDELLQMRNGLMATIKERKLPCPMEDALAKIAQLEKAMPAPPAEDNTKTQENLDTARKEIESLHADVENLNAAVMEFHAKQRDALCSHIQTLRSISGEAIDFKQVCDELKEKGNDEVGGILKDLIDKVDTAKIAGTLNSGLSNNPTGTVADPTLVVDNLNKDKKVEGTVQVTQEMKNQIRLNWLQVRRHHGQEAADKFLADCVAKGIIPADWPVKEQS